MAFTLYTPRDAAAREQAMRDGLGLYTDSPVFGARREKWRRGTLRPRMCATAERLSPGLAVSGVLGVTRTP